MEKCEAVIRQIFHQASDEELRELFNFSKKDRSVLSVMLLGALEEVCKDRKIT